MLRVHTRSGSTYEVDEPNKKVRRLDGVRAPTFRFGTDGDWKSYHQLFLKEGESMLIIWGMGTGDDGANAEVIGGIPGAPVEEDRMRLRMTETSRVLKIEVVE